MVTRKKIAESSGDIEPKPGRGRVKPVAAVTEERAAGAPPSAEGVLADTQAVVREALKNGDHRTALKGLEMLGKHFGLFGDRAEPGPEASGRVLIYQLPDNGRDRSPGNDAKHGTNG